MKKIVTGALALLLAGVLSGCMSFDYVGQEFAPTPESQSVDYYVNRSMVPPGKYQIIGRATVDGPDGIDTYDIQELLLRKARACGADAVVITGVKKVKVGTYQAREDVFNGPNTDLTPISFGPDGEPVSINTFGDEVVPLRGETYYREDVKVQALFLKDRAEVRKLLAERGRELDELLAQPVVEPARPEEPLEAEELVEPAAKESAQTAEPEKAERK